jgi:glycosyltransferase involved in cell wall biosynthesis
MTSSPKRILVTTDAFPPNCGGSGWSTYELVRGLRARGHHVDVVRAVAGSATELRETGYDGIAVTEFRRRVPDIPLVRNLLKNERLWTALAVYLTDRIRASQIQIVHAQHVMTTVASVDAAWTTGARVVSTVRDYWPVCYWSDLIRDPRETALCPACTRDNMRRCVRPRPGGRFMLPPLRGQVITYMRRNLETKRRALARADAVIAVSAAIARDLDVRAPELSGAGTRVVTIPNPVDMTALDRARADAAPRADGPYVLFAGKLATNKGVQHLLPAIARAKITWPVVIVGDGPLRASLEEQARGSGLHVRFLGWLARDEVLAWMRHATILAFPSYGPESLSRVLIEAAALGVPIAAMDTGGTRDIITPGVTGLLSATPEEFSRDLGVLAGNADLRQTIGAAGATYAHERFAAPTVVARVDALYDSIFTDGPR